MKPSGNSGAADRAERIRPPPWDAKLDAGIAPFHGRGESAGLVFGKDGIAEGLVIR